MSSRDSSADSGTRKWPIKVTRHARAKTLRLRVDPRDGTVHLTIPPRASERKALAWAELQRDWIKAAVESAGPAEPLAHGSVVPLRGKDHVLAWQAGTSRTVRVEKSRIVAGGPEDLFAQRILRWLRAEAARLLDEETQEFAARAKVKIIRTGIGDPVSRWGSCSADGVIRYSWRLILAPDFVRRATVAHEVAHRIHMDHSPAFHALVARLLGKNPDPARLWLRRHGASLQRFGRL